MIGIQTNNTFIDIANVNFTCPTCHKNYSDQDDKYLDRCNKNKGWSTRISCSCGSKFYMTYDFKGDATSFKRK